MGEGPMSESMLKARQAWHDESDTPEEDRIISDAVYEYEHTRSARSLEIIRQVFAPDSTEGMTYVFVSSLPYNHDTLAILKAFAMAGHEIEDSDPIFRARLSAVNQLRFYPQEMYMNDEEYAELVAFFEQIKAKNEEDPIGFGARANHTSDALEYLNSRGAKKLRIKKKPKEPRHKPQPQAPQVAASAQTTDKAAPSTATASELPEPVASNPSPARNPWLWVGLLLLLLLAGLLLRKTRR